MYIFFDNAKEHTEKNQDVHEKPGFRFYRKNVILVKVK